MAEQIISIPCGRCAEPVIEQEAEFCWYCQKWLCYPCWDEVGHCGHPKADEANKRGAEIPVKGTIK